MHEIHEFVRAEGVWLDDAAPVGIQRGRPFVARADAIAPVIFIGKTSAWPANIGNLDGLERLDHVVADSTRVRNLRVRPYPHAFIDTAAEVFRELAEDVTVDCRAGFRCIDAQTYRIGVGSHGGAAERESRAQHHARDE